jgi:hypothetical protein
MPTSNVSTSADDRISAAIAFALAQRGKRYVWATAGPNTYDCSGLVFRAFEHGGYHFTGRPTTYTLVGMGSAVERSQLQRGDLVFPTSGHVQIYLGGGQVVEAASPKLGIRTSSLGNVWRARRLITGGTGGGSTAAATLGNINPGGGVGSAGAQSDSTLAIVGNALNWAGDPQHWRNVFMIILGVIICLIALNRMANVSGKIITAAESVA